MWIVDIPKSVVHNVHSKFFSVPYAFPGKALFYKAEQLAYLFPRVLSPSLIVYAK